MMVTVVFVPRGNLVPGVSGGDFEFIVISSHFFDPPKNFLFAVSA
jgi:hypothetical protein